MQNFRPVHINYGPAGFLASAASLLGNFPLNRDAVTMLKEARAFEGDDCEQRLGFEPMGLSAFLAQKPPTSAQRADAKQTFLRPLLRVSLAFMWIMAGVASLFLTPHAQSLALLEKLGLQGLAGNCGSIWRGISRYGSGVCPIGTVSDQTSRHGSDCLIVGYTLALSLVAPDMWSDPFGVLAKNIPLIVATMLMMSWQEE